jgi:hypothetical protein
MKLLFLPLFMLFLAWGSNLQAAPSFWQSNEIPTPTPLAPPQLDDSGEPVQGLTPTATPVIAPKVQIPTPTPTHEPGLTAKDPTEAAILSAVIPGAGQIYNGDILRGLTFTTLFGLGLWQTLDNFQLVPDSKGSSTTSAKNEDMGNLFGLMTLAVYGFGIQDANNGAIQYNKTHYLTLNFGVRPRVCAELAYNF